MDPHHHPLAPLPRAAQVPEGTRSSAAQHNPALSLSPPGRVLMRSAAQPSAALSLARSLLQDVFSSTTQHPHSLTSSLSSRTFPSRGERSSDCNSAIETRNVLRHSLRSPLHSFGWCAGATHPCLGKAFLPTGPVRTLPRAPIKVQLTLLVTLALKSLCVCLCVYVSD